MPSRCRRSPRAPIAGRSSGRRCWPSCCRRAPSPFATTARRATSRACRASSGSCVGTDPKTRFHEGTVLYEIDLLTDHKTGSFLDQQENHLRARDYARGRGLDTFSYHGGFALQLAQGCEKVLAVEQDELAAGRLAHNAKVNNLGNVEARHGNAFDVLRELERARREVRRGGGGSACVRQAQGRPARGGSRVQGAQPARVQAARARRHPHHLLVLGEDGAGAVRGPGAERRRGCGRAAQLLEKRGASRDHPMLAAVPETAYLKCYVYRALCILLAPCPG